MFSFFLNGINDLKLYRIIDLKEYAEYLQDTSNIQLINEIRTLRINGDESYKSKKRLLPYITPHSILNFRDLGSEENIKKNFVQFSNYIFLDIDTIPESHSITSYKNYILSEYKNVCSLVCYSASMQGVTILVKVSNKITFQNFHQIRNYVVKNIFKKEVIDTSTNDIGRALYISHDKDVYINYSSKVNIPESVLCSKEVDYISDGGGYNNKVKISSLPITSNRKLYTYNEIKSVLSFKTPVIVENPIVDFKEIHYVKIYPPLKIPDGKKHIVFSGILNCLHFLNPNIHADYYYSYLHFINLTRTTKRMQNVELIRFFDSVMTKLKNTGSKDIRFIMKRVHFNEKANLSSKIKVQIAKKINGLYKRFLTQNKIQEAVETLRNNNTPVTYKSIAKQIKMSAKTVALRIKEPKVDLELEIEIVNEQYKHLITDN